MGFSSTILGFSGFGLGISVGIGIGYCLFIYVQPTDIKGPDFVLLADQDSDTLQRMLSEMPLWVKSPDYDRVDWLNRFIDLMWPFLDRAICKTAKNFAGPVIAEQIPKYKIHSLQFEALTLGTLPPTFEGMKIYATNEKELIMEPSLKWATNCNILVVIKAFGLKATIQVVDLQVFTSPRIILKPLVPSFPCFANVSISLMKKPHIDFGLKVMGADLMAIPGLYRYVHELIKDQVANMYLWPQKLEVPILDIAKAMRRPVGVLNVKVLRAKNLEKKDLFGTSDPYVKLKLTEDRAPSKKTTVKHEDLNPKWNEEFNMVVRDPETQALELHVYDWEQIGKHDKMGSNTVPLKDLPHNEAKVMNLDLLNLNDPEFEKSPGQVELELTYKPLAEDDLRKENAQTRMAAPLPQAGIPSGRGGVLVVMVHGAQDLEGNYHNNPSAHVIFRGEEKRTKEIEDNKDPRWEEEFHFVLEEPPITDRLHVEVYSTSSNLIHREEFLGHIDIGLADVVHNWRINEKYHLIDSKNGMIQIELQWITAN